MLCGVRGRRDVMQQRGASQQSVRQAGKQSRLWFTLKLRRLVRYAAECPQSSSDQTEETEQIVILMNEKYFLHNDLKNVI